jgi:tetratricopeptide (TPR) repeat protein
MNLFEKAVKDYTSALTLAPNHFKSLNNRAFCYERLDELELALNDYSSALEIQPDNVSTLVNRAIVLERLER